MKSIKLLILTAFLGTFFFSSCEKQESIEKQDVFGKTPQLSYVPNQVIIKFTEGTNLKSTPASIELVGGQIKQIISTGAMEYEKKLKSLKSPEIYVVDTKLSTMDAINTLKGRPEIEYVEPNWIYQHFDVSNDPYYTNGSLWGMYGDLTSPSNIYGSQAGEAWANNHTGSADVWIGIIDEGYMYTHVDLAANAGTNPGEIAGNGIDDDGNGYIDDVYGWDFVNGDNSVFDGTDDDHGSHVAGTIGGVGGNGIGVAGMVWTVKLMDGKFLGKSGGSTTDAILAIDYFTDLKLRHGINIVATNNSWGGGGYSEALYEAIERANAAGILFIAAAGNETNDNDLTPSYPGSYPSDNIISVASITNIGGLSSFSNYGATTVDLGAPGSGIYSTVPAKVKGSITSGYASYSGTSMATPHVTGAAALYASTHPGATASEIKNAILSSVIPTPSLDGFCLTGGRLNVGGF